MQFHSSKQLIQYVKAVLFDDTLTATSILDCETALGCKQLGKDVKGYNRETLLKCAKEMCEGGLKEKYRQNEYFAKLLISTNGQTLVEASTDHDWGCGISLNDDRVLYLNCWYSQGILGEMLQSIREELIKGITLAVKQTPLSHKTMIGWTQLTPVMPKEHERA